MDPPPPKRRRYSWPDGGCGNVPGPPDDVDTVMFDAPHYNYSFHTTADEVVSDATPFAFASSSSPTSFLLEPLKRKTPTSPSDSSLHRVRRASDGALAQLASDGHSEFGIAYSRNYIFEDAQKMGPPFIPTTGRFCDTEEKSPLSPPNHFPSAHPIRISPLLPFNENLSFLSHASSHPSARSSSPTDSPNTASTSSPSARLPDSASSNSISVPPTASEHTERRADARKFGRLIIHRTPPTSNYTRRFGRIVIHRPTLAYWCADRKSTNLARPLKSILKKGTWYDLPTSLPTDSYAPAPSDKGKGKAKEVHFRADADLVACLETGKALPEYVREPSYVSAISIRKCLRKEVSRRLKATKGARSRKTKAEKLHDLVGGQVPTDEGWYERIMAAEDNRKNAAKDGFAALKRMARYLEEANGPEDAECRMMARMITHMDAKSQRYGW